MTQRDRMTNRLLFVSHTAEWTGPTNSLLRLLEHLDCRFEPTVLLPGDGPFTAALERAGIRSVSYPSLDRRHIGDMYRLVRDNGFDLVYGNNTSRVSRNALIAAKRAGVPFVCHVRGMGRRGQWKKLGFLRLADAVIAISHACARSVATYAGRHSLHVVHNGVDIPPLPPASGRPLVEGVPADVQLILCVGHICPRKAQHYAVEAMARIAAEYPKTHLLLVGALDRDPGYVSDLREQIRDLGLETHVSLLGFRSDVASLLYAADVFLHTAISEAQGRAVIEAMAAAVPVVAFDVDGVAETVEPDVTGLLCPVGNSEELAASVSTMLGDPKMRRRYGDRGRERAADLFSATTTARRIEQILDQALSAPRPLGKRARAPEGQKAASRSGIGR